jgi:hypothetical protein
MTPTKWGLVIALATLLVGVIAAVGTWVASGGSSSVTANHGSIAAGHDATNNTMTAPGARQ